MRFSHGVSAVFDDPNLVSVAGLGPVMALAERCGLCGLSARWLSLSGPGSPNPGLKIPALVGAMVAGADSIADTDLLRHGGMARLFTGIRAPSTLGSFLRTFTFGNVRQLDAVASRLLSNLGTHTPVLAGADQLAFVDIDDTVRETYGYAKQASGYGYSGVNGLNALIGVASTPIAAPVVTNSRLRRGAANSARGAARFVTDAVSNARGAGAAGEIIVRMDSAVSDAAVIAGRRRAAARFSVTARMNTSVQAAIAGIPDQAWTPIRYPNAIYDEDENRWILRGRGRRNHLHRLH